MERLAQQQTTCPFERDGSTTDVKLLIQWCQGPQLKLRDPNTMIVALSVRL